MNRRQLIQERADYVLKTNRIGRALPALILLSFPQGYEMTLSVLYCKNVMLMLSGVLSPAPNWSLSTESLPLGMFNPKGKAFSQLHVKSIKSDKTLK